MTSLILIISLIVAFKLIGYQQNANNMNISALGMFGIHIYSTVKIAPWGPPIISNQCPFYQMTWQKAKRF